MSPLRLLPRRWLAGAILILIVLIGSGVYAAVTYVKAVQRLREYSALQLEVEELRRRNQTIAELESELLRLRDLQEQMLNLAGIKPALGLEKDFDENAVFYRLMWPVEGEVVEGYDARERPWVEMVSTRRTVAAAGDGVVRTVEVVQPGKYRVLLDHGKDLQTVYADLELTLVAPGDTIAAGQVIALVGTRKDDVPPRLRFEVLREGEPVDPREYVRDEMVGGG